VERSLPTGVVGTTRGVPGRPADIDKERSTPLSGARVPCPPRFCDRGLQFRGDGVHEQGWSSEDAGCGTRT